MSANISVELKKIKKNAFYDMAKQQCREVSPHATDEGKASIKKKYDKLGIWAEVRGKGSEWVLKAQPLTHAVRNRKKILA